MRADQPRWVRGRRLRDDRGVIVPVQGAGREMLDARVRKAGFGAVRAGRRADPAWRRAVIRGAAAQGLVLVLSTTLLFWFLFFKLPSLWPVQNAVWIGAAALVPYGAVQLFLHLWFLSPEMGRQVVVCRTNAGECPACCYSIAGLDAAGDGCTVCPECGAAWRVQAAAEPAEVVMEMR